MISVSYKDVTAALMNDRTNFNARNKIILAGHSQASFLLAMLLRDLFDYAESLKDKLVTTALGGGLYLW